MHVTMAQANPVVGDVRGNLEKVKTCVRQAYGNTMVIFPEMMLTGYPLEDLVFSSDLQDECEQALDELARFIRDEESGKKALVGYLAAGAGLPYNAAALVSRDGVEATSYKIALPTYGVFDERRLFAPGDRIMVGEHEGTSFAVLICEDLWDQNGSALAQAKEARVEVLIAINGSPFEDGKRDRRVQAMDAAVTLTGAAYGVYVNMVGGQDDLVFDGGSFIYDRRRAGRVSQCPFFTEDLMTIDMNTLKGFFTLGSYKMEREETLYQAAVLGLRDYVGKNGFRGVVVGVSGGIDSALVAAMAADALGGHRVVGIAMPSEYSSQGSLTDAEALMANIGGEYRVQPIAAMVDAFQAGLKLTGVAAENLQARVRGTTLMGVSNEESLLVLTPGNKSELSVGYSTLYGDTVGGFAPLKDLFKVDVYGLARWRNRLFTFIPESSIEKPPSAELAPGQVDQDSLPDYDVLDAFLTDAIERRHGRAVLEDQYGEALTSDLLGKIKRAEWKRRQYPIGPKLSRLSFGRERFMPITNRASGPR